MNYEEQLMVDHSRNNADLITNAIGGNAKEFKKIIDIVYNGKAPLPQRASWIISSVSEKHPELVTPYVPQLIDTVKSFKIDGIKRNIQNALTKQSIPEDYQAKTIDICFEFMLDPKETVAVKVLSMQIIANLCKVYPELIPELKAAIDDQLPKTTAAFHARARHVLKEIGY
jgi:uncharacterized membrane protein